MWLLTRNDKEILKEDGEWCLSIWSNPDDWRLFKSHDDAKDHAEHSGFAEFVRPCHAKLVFQERYESEERMENREDSLLSSCEYVPLPEPLTFHATTDEYDIPTFTSFNVTHYIVSAGVLCGVLGYGSEDGSYMPLQSIVGDEFGYAFGEIYRLSRPTTDNENSVGAVSYTHLTLPTKRIV